MIVVDTNVLVYLLLSGYENEKSHEVFQKDMNWMIPSLARREFCNTLLMHYRKELVTYMEAKELLKTFDKLVNDKTYDVSPSQVLEVGLNSTLSIYDSEFIGLAKKHNCTLVTNDKKILRSFPEIAQSPKQFIGLT